MAGGIWQFSRPVSTPGDPDVYPIDRVGSAVIVVARPPEMIAGFGGSVAMLAAAGVRLRIIVAADGERADTAAAPAQLLLALKRLGAAKAEIIALSSRPSPASGRVDEVTRRLGYLVQGFDLCAAPWSADHGSDSGSVRWAALLACSLRLRPPLVEYWDGRPEGASDCGAEPWQRAAWIELSRQSARAKHYADEIWAGTGNGPPPASSTTAHRRRPFPCDHELVFR